MNKIKKVIIIIIPLILAIYQVYLVNRIWGFSKRINLMIGIFCVCALYFIFYLFYKKINYREISKKSMILVIILSFLLSCFILILDFDFFSKKYTEATVILTQENKGETSEIPIKNIIVDNMPQDMNNIQRKSQFIELNFKKSKEIILMLEKNQSQGVITIKDGDKTKNVNLYSYKDDIYQYKVESNKTISFFSIVRIVLSFIMIEILSFILCISSYYLYKKEKSLILPTLFIIAIIQIIFYHQCVPYTRCNDTFDYEAEYTKEQVLKGELQGRVPIYPLIIKIFKLICGDTLWSNFICIAQIIISFISLIYLYKTLKLLINWEFLRTGIVFLYGINLAIIGWNNVLITESFALSGTILFIFYIISYIKDKKLKYGILSVILAFLITFLRPACIVYMAILFCFFLLRIIIDKKQRKKDARCFIISVITIVITLVYATVYYKQHDIFSITKVSVRQDLYICMDQGFYKNSKNEEFIKDVENRIEESKKENKVFFLAMEEVLRDYGNKEIQELVKISKKESMKQYIEYVINIIKTQYNESFDAYYTLYAKDTINTNVNFLKSFIFLKFSVVYFIVIIEGFLCIYRWVKYKKANWINLGLFGFLMAILITTFIGTNSEFMRTAICVVPFSYIAIGTIISDCIEKYKQGEEKEGKVL